MPVTWLDKLSALSTTDKPLTYSTFNPYFSISAKSWVRGGIGKLLCLVPKQAMNYTAAAAPNLVPRVLSYSYGGGLEEVTLGTRLRQCAAHLVTLRLQGTLAARFWISPKEMEK